MDINYTAPPTVSRFLKSKKFVRGIVGPIGSGKSVACCVEVMRRALEQAPGKDGIKHTRFAVIRNTYRELADTTVKTWQDWFGDTGRFYPSDMCHVIKTPELHCEILFRALDRPDDVKKLLSLELTGAWVNEAREVPRAVVDMLQGRVGRYPSKRDGGPTWYGLILDTNPPDTDHWWYRLFEEDRPDDWGIFRQPSGRSPKAENIGNLPTGYYDRIIGGKSDDWVKIYVDGQYGHTQTGKAIFPEFADGVHVQETKPFVGAVTVGIDFGLTPAAVFGQRDSRGRWYIHSELVSEDMGAVRFAELLKREMNVLYPGYSFDVWGDPAGEQRSQVDERTPFQILIANKIIAKPANTNDFTIRRESVAGTMTRMIDGKPGLIVNPACKVLRKALNGGYCFKRIQVSGDERYHDKPDKNQFSHVADALQYLMLGGGESRQVMKMPMHTEPIVMKQNWSPI